MMEAFVFAVASAFWLGILTSISPCPLATNIAAISYLAKNIERPRRVVAYGLMYTLGRMLAYFGVALIAIQGLIALSAISRFLQVDGNLILGVVLLVTGLVVLEIIPIPWLGRGGGVSERLKNRVERLGLWGAGLLGIVFALSFCPVSAALFFASLIPLAAKHESYVLMPGLYGLGTALPVVVFAVILAFFAHKLATAFNALTRVEFWLRKLTGVALVCLGAYYVVVNWLVAS